MTDMDLQGKVALVTGGSRGLGAACARRLAVCGADVAIAYLQSEAKAKAIAEDVRASGVRAAVFQADLGDRDQAVTMVDAVAAEFGHIDVLVNSAGIFLPGTIGALSAADADRLWAVNVHGLVATTGQAVNHSRLAAGSSTWGRPGASGPAGPALVTTLRPRRPSACTAARGRTSSRRAGSRSTRFSWASLRLTW